jgi:hypothetical protein
VTNTPTVSLAGGASVTVTNPLDSQNNATPLAVLEAVQPYEDTCTINFGGQSGGVCTLSTIPSQKRLVIQEFDAYGPLETGLQPIQLQFQVNIGAPFHAFPATLTGTGFGVNPYATHVETRLYAGPNYTPRFFVQISNSSNAVYTCTVSGFLLDVPQ